jgi:tRNA(fMet)-specific endonuclease VapC
MNALSAILDTDILSLLMRRNVAVAAKASSYLSEHHHFTISIITQYEILRGLNARTATRQALSFDDFCAKNAVLALTDHVIRRAAEVYGDLYRRGELIGDADILIAASALVNGFGIVTNNEGHFRRIDGLRVENWTR